MIAEWTPLVTDPAERMRVEAVVAELVRAVSAAALTASEPLVDRALVHAYIASEGADADDSLARAIDAPAAGLALYGGAARIGWGVAHLTEGDDAAAVTSAIDAAFARALAAPWTHHYDLVSGLVGFGVYALERGEAGHELAARVLDHLETLARDRDGGAAWFTPPELLTPTELGLSPTGMWTRGLAHGTAGVVALLARCVRAGVDTSRASGLLARAVAFLLAAPPSASPRVAWCHGDLGVASSLVAAAAACERTDWRDHALALALRCAARPVDAADGGLCHGAAGGAHVFHRLYQATGDAVLAGASRRWLALALATDAPASDMSLLTGAAGIALALAASVSEMDPRWDRLLLVDGLDP